MSVKFDGREHILDFMDKLAAAGHGITFIDNVMVVRDESTVQSMIDSYTVSDAIKPLIIAVKLEAKRRITEVLPEWKQSNCNARMNELNDMRLSGHELTVQEQSEIAALRSIWQVAKDIRAVSDAHELALSKLTTFQAVAAYDIKSGWPE